MIVPGNFEHVVINLRQANPHGSFEYRDPNLSFRSIVSSEFSSSASTYGIYIIRRTESQDVLYVGKGGTINTEGRFKGQDVPGRLKNVRMSDMSADDWFKQVVESQGRLTIEYVVLGKELSPGFVEAYLLQAYFNDHRRLPILNNAL